MIYYIQEHENRKAPIKIGSTSKDPLQRLCELQTGYPRALCVLATRTGDAQVERLEHRRWKHLHLNGEWFKAEADLLAYVDSLGCQPIVTGRTRGLPSPDPEATDASIPRPLPCCRCGEDVFQAPVLANVEWAYRWENGVSQITSIRWRHKKCHIGNRGWGGWEEIGDLLNPYVFLDFVMTTMNGLQTGAHTFTPEAYEDMKTILLACGARVVRPMTDEHNDRVKELSEFSRAFGGLG